MTLQNNPNGSPEVVTEKKKNVNIHGLLKSAIEREFGTPLDPIQFDAYKKQINTIQNKIATHMHDLKGENPEEWHDVTDEMIQKEAQKDAIIERLNYMSRDLILRRKRATERALELFPSLHDQANGLSKLQSEIALLDENKLQNLYMRTPMMKKFIFKIFPDLKTVAPVEKRKFEALFHDKDAHFDTDGKNKLEKIFSNYETYHQSPSSEDIAFILSAYKNVADTRKKEILVGLSVTLTIKDAYHEFGLIDDAFLRTFAEKEWEGFYADLSDEKKSTFIRTLSYNESQVLSPKDFSIAKLTDIFTNDKKRAKLSTEISRAIGIDLPERDVGGNDILSEIRQEKRKEAEMLGKLDEDKGDTDNYELHDAFVDKMEKTLRNGSGMSRVEHIEKLKHEGSVIQFNHGDTTQFVKLVRFQDENGFPLETKVVGEYGLELQGFSINDGRVFNAENFKSSYDTFARFLGDQKDVKILTSQEFETLFTKDESEFKKGEKFFDARSLKTDPITKENIAKKLDLLDSSGSAFGFEKGTCFIAPSHDTKTGDISRDEIWQVEKVHGDMVDLMDAGGHSLAKDIPLEDVYTTLSESQGFKRIYKIESDADMVRELSVFDLDSSAVLEGGKLIQKLKDEHHKEVKKEITCFKSESGHIRIESLDNGIVKFGEFEDGETDKLKKHAEKKGYDKVVKSYYHWKVMSYPAFLKYLAKNKLKATTKDVIVPEVGHDLHGKHDHHHPHAHTEGSFFKRLMLMQNPASIWKGFEMIYHSIEHTLEKGAKLDAARFAMGTAKFLKLPDSVSAQIYADIVDGSKEIIEKYEKKIFGLPGPRGREKCIHIVHNRDSRPEEVMSAVNYMIKSYGHLYAEDIKHYQPIVNKSNIETADPGYFAFFDALVMTSKVGDLKHWRKEAYIKAIGEMGTLDDHENEPTEEQLIHAFCKAIDGDWEMYPYAASVVKAMGGPSGFEKNWKFEGYDNAHKKGKDQTQMVSIRGRLNKAMGYFGTHEIYKVVGAMEAVAAKTKEPRDQVVPFIWAVGGFSRYASHTALQKLKGYASNGMTFHAYAFLRNEKANSLYRDTVRLALKHKGGDGLVSEFDALCKKLEFNVDDKKSTKGAAANMMDFWQKHCNSGLHDMLQGQNGWLLAMKKQGNKTATEYFDSLSTGHSEMLNDDGIPGDEKGKDWYDEHGYKNLIMAKNKEGQRSLGRMLKKILFEGTSPGGGRSMKNDHYEKIWHYIKEYMNGSLRDTEMFLGDEALQKEQYLAHRREILAYFSQKLNTTVLESREGKEKAQAIMMQNIKEYPYYTDLANMGITPQAVFSKEIALSVEENDYQAWKNGTPRTVGKSLSGGGGNAFDVKDLFQEKAAHVVTRKPGNSTTTDQDHVDPDSIGASYGGIVDLAEN